MSHPRCTSFSMKMTDVDGKIALLGELQHGLVLGRQTIELGLSMTQRRHRGARGLLVPYDHDVFRLGGAPVTWPQRVLAACLASDGVASHRTAAMLHRVEVGRDLASTFHAASTPRDVDSRVGL